jgi:DNA-binding NarL/FixJ family response regulator
MNPAMTSQHDCPSPRNIFLVLADEDTGQELCRRLTATPGLRCCGVATSLQDGLEMLRPGSAHAIIVGGLLPDSGLWNSIRAFRDLDSAAGVVVLSDEPSVDSLREARLAGAAGFISRDTPFDEVVPLLWLGLRGRMFVDADVVLAMSDSRPAGGTTRPNGERRAPRDVALTSREQEVLQLLGRGLDPSSIAGELDLSIHTARGHVKRILAKLGAHSQLEAVVIAVQLGLLHGLGPDTSQGSAAH